MLEFDKDYIPLFLQINDRINSMIIDNTLLGTSTDLSSCNHFPYRAFTLIMQLFHNDLTREVFPERLQNILDIDFTINKGFYHELLVGEEDQNYYHFGITLDMKITDDSVAPVQLDNIQYNNGSNFFPLKRVITLTPQQALYIFSNILLNDRIYLYNHIYHHEKFLKTTLSDFTADVIEHDSWRLNRYGKVYTILNRFSFEYLHHIAIEILGNQLSPASLLHYSGATVLGFLRHLPPIDTYLSEVIDILRNYASGSINQEVLYYTLLYNSRSNITASDKVFRFLEDHRVTWKAKCNVAPTKEFPKSDTMKDF